MFEMEAMTLLGVNDLQKQLQQQHYFLYFIFVVACRRSLSLSVGGRIRGMNDDR
jgi:hypothetical protein